MGCNKRGSTVLSSFPVALWQPTFSTFPPSLPSQIKYKYRGRGRAVGGGGCGAVGGGGGGAVGGSGCGAVGGGGGEGEVDRSGGGAVLSLFFRLDILSPRPVGQLRQQPSRPRPRLPGDIHIYAIINGTIAWHPREA